MSKAELYKVTDTEENKPYIRKNIDFEKTPFQKIFLIMSEADAGGGDVISKLLEKSFQYLIDLDDMNIRGGQIWLAYEYCNKNIETLMDYITNRDVKMVNSINEQLSKLNQPNIPKAEIYGASDRSVRLVLDVK